MICWLRLFCKENSFSSAFLGTDSYDTLFQAADGIDDYTVPARNKKQGRSSNGSYGSDLGRSSFFRNICFCRHRNINRIWKQCNRIIEDEIDEAEAIVVGGASGMSAASGLSFIIRIMLFRDCVMAWSRNNRCQHSWHLNIIGRHSDKHCLFRYFTSGKAFFQMSCRKSTSVRTVINDCALGRVPSL